jgi:hypothetical protein
MSRLPPSAQLHSPVHQVIADTEANTNLVEDLGCDFLAAFSVALANAREGEDRHQQGAIKPLAKTGRSARGHDAQPSQSAGFADQWNAA